MPATYDPLSSPLLSNPHCLPPVPPPQTRLAVVLGTRRALESFTLEDIFSIHTARPNRALSTNFGAIGSFVITGVLTEVDTVPATVIGNPDSGIYQLNGQIFVQGGTNVTYFFQYVLGTEFGPNTITTPPVNLTATGSPQQVDGTVGGLLGGPWIFRLVLIENPGTASARTLYGNPLNVRDAPATAAPTTSPAYACDGPAVGSSEPGPACLKKCLKRAKNALKGAKKTACTKAAFPGAKDKRLCQYRARAQYERAVACCYTTTCYY